MSRETLRRLVGLTLRQPWLEQKEDELLDLLELCESQQEADLIVDLLYRFNAMSSRDFDSALGKMVDAMIVDLALHPDRTIFVAPEKSDFIDGSHSILWKAKAQFGRYDDWNSSHFVASLRAAVDRVKPDDTVILLEEFIGSGGSASRAYAWLKGQLDKKQVNARVVCFALTGMQAGAQRLVDEGIEHYIKNIISRGISDHYTGDALVRATETMEKLEEKLCDLSDHGRLKKMHFGWERSEALYHLEGGNAVNNVFPVFWWKWLKGRVRRHPIMDRLQ